MTNAMNAGVKEELQKLVDKYNTENDTMEKDLASGNLPVTRRIVVFAMIERNAELVSELEGIIDTLI